MTPQYPEEIKSAYLKQSISVNYF